MASGTLCRRRNLIVSGMEGQAGFWEKFGKQLLLTNKIVPELVGS